MAMAVRARALTSKPAISSLLASRPFFSSSLLRHRPVAAALSELRRLPAVPETGVFRCFSTRPTTSSLNDPSPNWSNRPPKETILLDGCDFEHWLVVMEPPEGNPTRDDIIDSYIKTLAEVVGSPEEARMKIYSVSTKHYFAFGALVSEELSLKLKELPKVRWVLPDSYLDVKNKDYGGEPFINGQAVPYDPKYHEEWVRNNARANERSRRNDRPRNYDRSRNFERRRENMQNRDFQNTAPPPPPMPNTQTAVPGGPGGQNFNRDQPAVPGGPGGQNFNRDQPMTSMPNAGYTNQGVPPPNSGMPNSGFQSRPMGGMNGPNYQNQGTGGIPNSAYPNHQGMGGAPSTGFPSPGSGYQNKEMGGMPPSTSFQGPGSGYQNKEMGGMPNGSYQNQVPGGYVNQGNGFQNQGNYQNQGNFPNQGNYHSPGNFLNQGMGGVPNSGYQNNFVPNREVGGTSNANAYQARDMPGRDAPTVPSRDY